MKENILNIKDQERAEIARLTEEFLAKGGKIEVGKKAAFEDRIEWIGYNNKRHVRSEKND